HADRERGLPREERAGGFHPSHAIRFGALSSRECHRLGPSLSPSRVRRAKEPLVSISDNTPASDATTPENDAVPAESAVVPPSPENDAVPAEPAAETTTPENDAVPAE